MQLFKREWKSYIKPTFYWCIGLVLLIGIAFYKVDGMGSVEGGMNAMMDALPPAFQMIFGVGTDYASGIGMYSFIHLYILIALSFHAVILGSSIFTKEEFDKTFEFLYVKGMKRKVIITIKIIAGCSILLFLNLICLTTVILSLSIMDKPFILIDILPFFIGLAMAQLFFFSVTFLLSFILPNNQKAGIIGCSIVLVMFLVSMYTKLGGNVDFLNQLSLFLYLDAGRIQNVGLELLPFSMMIGCTMIFLIISILRHEHRDLL